MSVSNGTNSPNLPPISDFKTLNIQIQRLAQRIFNLETGDPPASSAPAMPTNVGTLPGGPNDPLNIYTTPSSSPIVTPVPFDFGALFNNLAASKKVTFNGTTAGTFTWVMPIQQANLKVFMGLYTGYENTTGSSQDITFPTAYAFAPHLFADASAESGQPAATKSTTVLHLPVGMGATVTGWLLTMGW